tara:strand:+ start:3243 stop:3443 length:201 start_codon:yes stop_codon:yes gene_type:complete
MIDGNVDEAGNGNVWAGKGWEWMGKDRIGSERVGWGTGTGHPSSTRDEKIGLGLEVVRGWVGGCGC